MQRSFHQPLFSVLNRKNKSIKGSRILVFGVAYKKDINDPRESAAVEVISDLLRKGARVDYHDPFVKEFTIEADNYLKKYGSDKNGFGRLQAGIFEKL